MLLPTSLCYIPPFNLIKKECMFVSIVLKLHYNFNYLEKLGLHITSRFLCQNFEEKKKVGGIFCRNLDDFSFYF